MTEQIYEVCSPTVVGEVIDGEAIIMNLNTGVYYSTTGLGAALWKAIEEGASRSALLSWIGTTYSDAATADVGAFLDDLAERGLIRFGNGAAMAMGLTDPPATYRAPVLSVHEDMQDLIQLDPIHEVAEVGWPVRKAEA